MPTYDYTRLERVIWDVPAAEAIRNEAERLQRCRVLLLASKTLSRETELVSGIRAALGERCVGIVDEMPAHVPRPAVLQAAAAIIETRSDLVVAIGGGSVVDGAKMAQVAASYGFRTVEQLDGLSERLAIDARRSLAPRQIAVTTTLSAAEFGWGAGSTDIRGQPIKHVVRHPDLMPITVVLDPRMTLATPEKLWLSTGMRALDHAVETLCSTRATPFTDALARQALILLTSGLRRSHRDRTALAARSDAQLGAWMSMAAVPGGIPLGASHAIGHVLGGAFNVPHGYTTCVILPAVLRHHAAVTATAQCVIAEAMDAPTQSAAEAIASLVAEFGLPRTLSDVGISEADFPVIAKQTMAERWAETNPRPLRKLADVFEILQLAM